VAMLGQDFAVTHARTVRNFIWCMIRRHTHTHARTHTTTRIIALKRNTQSCWLRYSN
jgi:hypothetical protein